MPDPTNTPRKITLEDLLRLKRHERPGSEFWARFDRELNEKVWRTLVQPPPREHGLAAFWRQRVRWLVAGAASIAAVFVSWSDHTPSPLATIQPTMTATVVANVVAPPDASVPSEPVRIASANPATEKVAPLPSDAPAQYAVSTFEPSVNPAGSHKVPATVAFAAAELPGIHFATDTLATAVIPVRWRETAY